MPVLILGESGTGKEVLAQYIHKMSAYSKGPFVKVNCAAMPSDLLESELLGYEEGAFTGAIKSKPGKFELTDHGTIFLDEIGEMSPLLKIEIIQFRERQCTIVDLSSKGGHIPTCRLTGSGLASVSDPPFVTYLFRDYSSNRGLHRR